MERFLEKTPEELRKIFTPRIAVCVVCGGEYEYFKKGRYPGKSPERCPKHQQEYLEIRNKSSLPGTGHRNAGHKTRQQHKNVHPTR